MHESPDANPGQSPGLADPAEGLSDSMATLDGSQHLTLKNFRQYKPKPGSWSALADHVHQKPATSAKQSITPLRRNVQVITMWEGEKKSTFLYLKIL